MLLKVKIPICCFCFDIQNNFGTQHVLQMLRASEKDLPVIIKSQLTINFMFPVPEASVPAVLICSDKSAPGKINSAMETL